MIHLGAVSRAELAQFISATRESAVASAEIFAPSGKRPKAG
jgi:hypothetical protein